MVLQRIQWINFVQKGFEPGMEELVRNLLEKQAGPLT